MIGVEVRRQAKRRRTLYAFLALLAIPAVVLAALVCGAFWSTERLVTGSLVASLVSHAIWTFAIIHFYPVTAS